MRCWEILGIPDTATVEEVKRAYRTLALSAHPDHGGTVADFHRLNLAFGQAVELAARPVLCAKCGGLGHVQHPAAFIVMTCEVCKGAGSHARE